MTVTKHNFGVLVVLNISRLRVILYDYELFVNCSNCSTSFYQLCCNNFPIVYMLHVAIIYQFISVRVCKNIFPITCYQRYP